MLNERNRVLENLSLQGSWQDLYFPGRYLDAPALKHLIVREVDFSDYEDDWHPDDGEEPAHDESDDEEPAIAAPQLRELVADARLLCQLTSESLAALESLVLYIGACRYFRPEREWSALRMIKHHQGTLRLVVASRGAFEALAFLSSSSGLSSWR